jgi:type II secretory pathway pseudopilin PulG
MQAFWIIIIIAWVIIPIIAKKKQQQAKEQAAREQAARQRAAQAATQQRVQQPVRTAPIAPTVRTNVQATFEGAASGEGVGSSEEGAPARQIESTLKSKTSTLTQIRVYPEHVVRATSESGHTHEESSMTGVEKECAPDVKKTVAATVTAVPESAFVWDVSQARSGLILAEVLGPCLALRNE